MVRYREAHGVSPDTGWEDYTAVKGIGPGTLKKVYEFVDKDDPFDIELTGRVLDEIREGIRRNRVGFRGLPKPTHKSHEIPRDRDCVVTWMGVVRKVEHKDLIEDERARSGDSLDEIMARTKDNHLVKSCVLHCYDDGDDDVYVRISRYNWPKWRETVERIETMRDVVIVRGKKKQSFGVNLQLDRLVLLQNTEDEEDE